MPKARVVTQPEPDDALHLICIQNNYIHRCCNPACNHTFKKKEQAWWDHRDKMLYCRLSMDACKGWRLSPEGITYAVMQRLLGK